MRIDGGGMINDVIMDTSHDVICENNTREKDVVGIVTFDLIGLLPGGLLRTNNIIAYITIAYRSEETFDVNSKIAQTTQCI